MNTTFIINIIFCFLNQGINSKFFLKNGTRFVHQVNANKLSKISINCGQPTYETHPHLLRKNEVSLRCTIKNYEQLRLYLCVC